MVDPPKIELWCQQSAGALCLLITSSIMEHLSRERGINTSAHTGFYAAKVSLQMIHDVIVAPPGIKFRHKISTRFPGAFFVVFT